MGQWNSQVFTAPGTWTWPGNVSNALVYLVGGGGGGVEVFPGNIYAGGGGGVRRLFVPVTAPVSVTVGAGGSGIYYAAFPVTSSNPGGSSSFGPYSVGGGGGALFPAPPTGGGGGSGGKTSAWLPTVSSPSIGGLGGTYGYPGLLRMGGGAGGTGVASPGTNSSGAHWGARGRYGFGGGGIVGTNVVAFDGGKRYPSSPADVYYPNTGGGGVGSASPNASAGRVEVYWFE